MDSHYLQVPTGTGRLVAGCRGRNLRTLVLLLLSFEMCFAFVTLLINLCPHANSFLDFDAS